MQEASHYNDSFSNEQQKKQTFSVRLSQSNDYSGECAGAKDPFFFKFDDLGNNEMKSHICLLLYV